MAQRTSRIVVVLACAGLLCLHSGTRAQTQPPPEPQTAPATVSPLRSDDLDTVFVMLDRIDRVVSDARGDRDPDKLKAVGTAGAAEAKVSIEVASLDEIRAEVAQIKRILRRPE